MILSSPPLHGSPRRSAKNTLLYADNLAPTMESRVTSAAEYLALKYSQLRYAQVVELLANSGKLTRAEIEKGRPAKGTQKEVPTITPSEVAAWFSKGNPKRRDVALPPGFQKGQRVRARNINPPTHTRLNPNLLP